MTTATIGKKIEKSFYNKRREIVSKLLDSVDMPHLIRLMRDEINWYDSNQIVKELGPRSMHAIISSSMQGNSPVIAGNSALMESSGHVDPLAREPLDTLD